MPDTMKLTLLFPPAIAGALQIAAKTQRKEVTEIIHRATVDRLIEDGFITGADKDEHIMFWELVDEAVKVAVERVKQGHFNSAITLDTFRICVDRPAWRSKAEKYLGESVYRHGNEKKGRLNREIGFRIRAALNAVVDREPNGKTNTVKVTGEMIQSYSPFLSYDKSAF